MGNPLNWEVFFVCLTWTKEKKKQDLILFYISISFKREIAIIHIV